MLLHEIANDFRIMYIAFFTLYLLLYTEKISPRHVRRWAGHCAHTRKKRIKKLRNLKKNLKLRGDISPPATNFLTSSQNLRKSRY